MEQAMAFDDTNFDPVKYGVLWERVQVMDKKMDKMERQLEELVGLANKGKGGLWFGMAVASGVSGFVGFLISHIKGN
jgi:hypothetical protein